MTGECTIGARRFHCELSEEHAPFTGKTVWVLDGLVLDSSDTSNSQGRLVCDESLEDILKESPSLMLQFIEWGCPPKEACQIVSDAIGRKERGVKIHNGEVQEVA